MNLISILPKWFLSHSWLNVKSCILPMAQNGPVPFPPIKPFHFPCEACEIWQCDSGRQALLEKRLFSLVSSMLSEHFVRTHHTRSICSLTWSTENSFTLKIILNQAQCCFITSQRHMPLFPSVVRANHWPVLIMHFNPWSCGVCSGFSVPGSWKQC